MTKPILPQPHAGTPEPTSLPQRSSAPRGLSEVPSTLERETLQSSPIQGGHCLQGLLNLFHRIYQGLISCLNAIKGLFLGHEIVEDPSADEISRALARFNNTGVRGQINGIYITTNETNLAATRQFFTNHPRPSPETQTIHIGCASWHNLDILCARRSTYGLIVDFNPKNAEFIRKTIEFIQSSPSRDVFKATMNTYLNSLIGWERNVFFHRDQQGLPTERIDRELSREGSWLHSEESYLYLKEEVISRGRLVPITEDIKDFESFSRIKAFLDRNHIVVDTLYLSNICNFMNTNNDKASFAKSIRNLLHRESLFISCPKKTTGEVLLRQNAVLGSEILTDSYDLSQLFEV